MDQDRDKNSNYSPNVSALTPSKMRRVLNRLQGAMEEQIRMDEQVSMEDQRISLNGQSAVEEVAEAFARLPNPPDRSPANDVISAADQIYRYDAREQREILVANPWMKDPHYFKHVKISALALLKMVMHARSGGSLEIMGMLQGKITGNGTMVVMDSFALPVLGTETQVNAHEQAYEYMTNYIDTSKKVSRFENVIGWYHSHPGYGCWLSGIDVTTQLLNQSFQDPFVAVVIDPKATISAGKVCLGAFRTYPNGYSPANEEASEYQTIPADKIEDFGVHSKLYYSLEVSYFKSSLDKKLLDSLWNKYWVNTLSSSSLLTNIDYTTRQIFNLTEKLEIFEQALNQNTALKRVEPRHSDYNKDKNLDKLHDATRDSCKVCIEVMHGLISQVIKDELFNKVNIKCIGNDFQ